VTAANVPVVDSRAQNSVKQPLTGPDVEYSVAVSKSCVSTGRELSMWG
jgi:hypothetical protein